MSKDLTAEHFINRELSWLEFNSRVLEEAQDDSNPLLERVKFLSIVSSNLDEFFMVRVAGLREQAFGSGAAQDKSSDELRAVDQLRAIAKRARKLVAVQYRCLNESVLPALAEEGIRVVTVDQLDKKQQEHIDKLFQESVFPILTPMAIDPSHPRPRYHNRGLYLAAELRRRRGRGPKNLLAVVQLPQILPRMVEVPHERERWFVFIEDLVRSRLPELFGGFEVKSSATFRITRDNDTELLEQESDDMLRLIEERLRARRRADAVRMEVAADANEELIRQITVQEQISNDPADGDYSELYQIPGPLDLRGLMALIRISNFERLRDKPFLPSTPQGLRRRGEDLFDAIARHDVLLHHPYDSFEPVTEFVDRAADDPRVLAIKQSLYRTSGDSPIVAALMRAAENGKHVTALVELKARFDEEANIVWARQMERAGVHVVYGFLDLKTHCKVCLVVRQEDERVRQYVHLSTGNYNSTTAKLYTDLGLFTANEDMANDATALFNLLTGYSQGHEWRKLIVAPDDLQRRTIELIDEQTKRAQQGQPARIFAKLNSIVDREVIEALYRASQAGMSIDLVIRGICCLRPGIPGVSENIRVRSIVDRFLEHSRICVFGPDENAKIYLSSADWMPRNFFRRVEVMFPIEAAALKKRILQQLIPVYLGDNQRARELAADGKYEHVQPTDGQAGRRCQEELLVLHAAAATSTRSRITGNGDKDE